MNSDNPYRPPEEETNLSAKPLYSRCFRYVILRFPGTLTATVFSVAITTSIIVHEWWYGFYVTPPKLLTLLAIPGIMTSYVFATITDSLAATWTSFILAMLIFYGGIGLSVDLVRHWLLAKIEAIDKACGNDNTNEQRKEKRV